MKFKIIYIAAFIFFIIVIVIGSYTIVNTNNLDSINIFYLNHTNTSKNNVSTISPSPTIDYNSSLTIPSDDYVINHINWTAYPNLERGYVQEAQILDTNGGSINHKFIDVAIYVEINNEDDVTIILDQMRGVLKEARTIYGPNSRIFIIGNKNGVFDHAIDLTPYDDTIFGD